MLSTQRKAVAAWKSTAWEGSTLLMAAFSCCHGASLRVQQMPSPPIVMLGSGVVQETRVFGVGQIRRRVAAMPWRRRW